MADSDQKTVGLLYGKTGMEVTVPASAVVLEGRPPGPVADAAAAVRAALAEPIGAAPLAELLAAKRPGTVAVTVSDITRPVPNGDFLPPMLEVLNAAGVDDSRIVVIIGTGMHRSSTDEEREALVGPGVASRVEVIDHVAADAESLVRVSDDPPVSVCRRFAEADFRIVTGFIEPHFMAGFSGGRKGVCPALVDLATIGRFHGHEALADPRADSGVLEGNPCHEIALAVAKAVGVDFLFNVALSRDRKIAGVYCGDLEAAHLAGCRDVAEWATATVDGPFDLVVTSGGGHPLDATFYQTVKGMCGALPALGPESHLLIASECPEQLGSPAFTELMAKWSGDWQGFLADITAHPERTELDQWEFQMQSRVLARIGMDRLHLVSGGMPPVTQRHIGVSPVLGEGSAAARANAFIIGFLDEHPEARVAVIPDGPYTMLRAG